MAFTVSEASKRKHSKKEWHKFWLGLAFSSPFIIGFLGLTVFPFIESFYYSLTDYDLFNSPNWVGFQNYLDIFHDDAFYKSIINTMFMAFIGTPVSLIISLLIALLLNMKVKGVSIYRAIYYLPSVIPVVASSILWMWVFNPQYGIIDTFLRAVHLPDPSWFLDPNFTKPALIIMGLWGTGGGALIYLAALQGIPKELYEAASIDGATMWHRFRFITLAALSPITLFQLIMGLIGSFQIFTESFILAGNSAQGGPDQSMLFYAVNLYQEAFVNLHMGYASALAWILFVIVMLITLIIFKTSLRWVYYGGE
ncbi:multiple sugar transport system permease protein [Pullulanibacillus pueri]|uniref:Spermidine/putrescine ABC transporter permease n=1 Tax=Pullulanibacillus pueri TaxID=1437324 RepID=A0A8J3EPR3_9BACL|nr:sugar ABC transporter permease [Pullulanibacillus pueri]MBM7683659.1 multiple sugar transport system permease protein [Pullulanibacillus pueri]GGH87195.1 spermidine/putrescine ABC transporter permease [Pullulanibacillus pueri]